MELLTGECKKQFDNYKSEMYDKWCRNGTVSFSYYGYSAFKELDLSMQYGVYKQFFTEKGIFIHIESYLTIDEETYHECFLNGNANGHIREDINNSYEQIIRIANKEYNDKNN